MLISNGVKGRKWHKDKKYWNFPNSDGTLEKILKVFEGEKIHIHRELAETIDPALQNVIARSEDSSPVIASTRRVRGNLNFGSERAQQSHHVLRITHHDFQDFHRELLSRKYSYKTVNPVRNPRYVTVKPKLASIGEIPC